MAEEGWAYVGDCLKTKQMNCSFWNWSRCSYRDKRM